MRRFKPGIGAVTQAERRGFTRESQLTALAECKVAQFKIQVGCCIFCTMPMTIQGCRWMSARGVVSTLNEWALAMTKTFSAETLCNTLHHRSPDEIRAEYANGNRGHELACRGCAMSRHYCMYGENGAGVAYRTEYERLVVERGLTEDQRHDPGVAMQLHHDVVKWLSQTRQARLLSVHGSVQPGDVAYKNKPRPPRRTRKSSSERRRGRRTKQSVKTYELGHAPDSDSNLRAAQEELLNRPETDLERQAREVLDQYGVKPQT